MIENDIVWQLNWVWEIGVVSCPSKARISMHIHLLCSKCRIHFTPLFCCRILRKHNISPSLISFPKPDWIHVTIRNHNFAVCALDKTRIRQNVLRLHQFHCIKCFKVVSRFYQVRTHLANPCFIIWVCGQHQKHFIRLIRRMRMCLRVEKMCDCLVDGMIHMICHNNWNKLPCKMACPWVCCFNVKYTAPKPRTARWKRNVNDLRKRPATDLSA